MKFALRILFVVSMTLIVYGYWGAFTSSGNKVYDEMDGYLPFFIMIGGTILLIVFFVILAILKIKGTK